MYSDATGTTSALLTSLEAELTRLTSLQAAQVAERDRLLASQQRLIQERVACSTNSCRATIDISQANLATRINATHVEINRLGGLINDTNNRIAAEKNSLASIAERTDPTIIAAKAQGEALIEQAKSKKSLYIIIGVVAFIVISLVVYFKLKK